MNFVKRYICFGLILVIILMLSGCNKDNGIGGAGEGEKDYVYLAQFIALPSNVGDIKHLTCYNDKVYFTATEFTYGAIDNQYLSSNTVAIYSMNLDGTDLASLSDYTVPMIKPDDVGGFIAIDQMTIDDEGFIWVAESWVFYTFALPENFNIENEEPWDYQEIHESHNIIRKLDYTGKELLSLDISDTKGQQEYLSISAFAVDNFEHIYIASWNYLESATIIYVLDSNGNMLLQHNTKLPYGFSKFIKMPDDAIAYPSANNYEYSANNQIQELHIIDVTPGVFNNTAKAVEIEGADKYDFTQIYTGGEEFDVLLSNNIGVYGYTFDEGKIILLFEWNESNVIKGIVEDMAVLADERIACMNTSLDNYAQQSGYEMIILTKTLRTDVPEEKIITLAAFSTNPDIEDAVAWFNRTNSEYSVEITDYSELYAEYDWNTAITRFTTEVVFGNIPDILYMSDLPYIDYAKSGMLSDLYPFIDADPQFERSDFVEVAFRAAEVDGKLCQIFPGFFISTVVGNPAVLGAGVGWNIDEVGDMLNAHPNADIPLGYNMTKTSFLIGSVTAGIDDFIDFETGAVSFDSDDFIQLLELSSRFPDDIDWEHINDEDIYVSPREAIASGRQLMQYTVINDYYSFQNQKNMFGGEIVFKGFPSNNRNGHFLQSEGGLAILENSENKEIAWSFVRAFLDKEWQINSFSVGNNFSFATNREAFNQIFDESLLKISSGDGSYALPSQADIDMVNELIGSACGFAAQRVDEAIYNIVREDAHNYFIGLKTAEDAAADIQYRVSIYVSERN